MEIVVVFEKIRKGDINGNPDELAAGLGRIAKSLSTENSSQDITVHMLEGQLPNAPTAMMVGLIVSSASLANNSGDFIIRFRNEAIRLFSKFGISLNKDTLFSRIVGVEDIDKVLSSLKKSSNVANQKKAEAFKSEEFDYEQKAKQYVPVDPLYSFDRVILPSAVVDKIIEAVGILECENTVFKKWGLYEIQPHPSTALSFFGPSGTGKTMAAEAIASKLGKKILKVSYADVESKYHGEGPKMVKAIFLAASKADAVLFFDEADSLLSKRLTNVTQGSEQAINSMRSQLLICLEEFHGIVIFATNLVINYDRAFLTRLISVEFVTPDSETRKRIWNVHIRPAMDGKPHMLNIPLSDDVSTSELAERYEFVGREIRNAVVSACVSVALEHREIVTQSDFIKACNQIIKEKEDLAIARQGEKSAQVDDYMKAAILNKIQEKREV